MSSFFKQFLKKKSKKINKNKKNKTTDEHRLTQIFILRQLWKSFLTKEGSAGFSHIHTNPYGQDEQD